MSISSEKNSIGVQLSRARKSRHLRQADVALLSGVSRATIIAAEKGTLGNVSTIDTIARSLGLRLALVASSDQADGEVNSKEVVPARRGQRFPTIFEIMAANKGIVS